MAVDHAWQHVQAAAIDHLRSRCTDVADAGDPVFGNRHVTHALAVLIDDRAALQDQVVSGGHRLSTYSKTAP